MADFCQTERKGLEPRSQDVQAEPTWRTSRAFLNAFSIVSGITYLKDVFLRLPTQPHSRIDELLPHR
jgi:hypothetical protein